MNKLLGEHQRLLEREEEHQALREQMQLENERIRNRKTPFKRAIDSVKEGSKELGKKIKQLATPSESKKRKKRVHPEQDEDEQEAKYEDMLHNTEVNKLMTQLSKMAALDKEVGTKANDRVWSH